MIHLITIFYKYIEIIFLESAVEEERMEALKSQFLATAEEIDRRRYLLQLMVQRKYPRAKRLIHLFPLHL